MAPLARRPLLAFVLGVLLAAAAFAGRAAYAALADEQVAGCYVPQSGALYVTGRSGAPSACLQGHIPIAWSMAGPAGPAGPAGAPGPPGPPGAFAGTFASPNGAYAISVDDGGIRLRGPGASIRLSGSTVLVTGATAIVRATRTATLESRGAVAVKGRSVTVKASGTIVLKGSKIKQN